MTDFDQLVAEMNAEVQKCVNCGFCESVCPTLPSSGFNAIIGARGRVDLGKAFVDDVKRNGRSELDMSESFYSCLDCFACLQVCPAGVNAGIVSEIGREIVAGSGEFTGSKENNFAKMVVEATMRYGNPLGVREKCSDWADGLEFNHNSDTLLYTGNMYQLMAFSESLSRMQRYMGSLAELLAGVVANHTTLIKITGSMANRETQYRVNGFLKSIYKLLRMAGVDFNYLGKEEPYPGTFIYDLGYKEKFLEYGKRVIELFRNHGVRTIITVDPHTYDILNNQYRENFKDFDFEVVHYLDYLNDLRFSHNRGTVTLHEPCHFVLRNNTYSKPTEILRRVADVIYPERSGKHTLCCGGPAELMFGNLTKNISEKRFDQLKAAGADNIVTACPICYVNLNKDGSITDLSQYLLESL
ncbi:MAG: (Fe-S)-binding protein [Thermoplasmataceae archaeon]